MKKYDGFLFIDALLSMSLVSIICIVLLPISFQLNQKYEQSLVELEKTRAIYIEVVVNHEAIVQNDNQICLKKVPTSCIQIPIE